MGFLSDAFKGSGGSIVSGMLGATTGLIGTQSRNDNAWALANMNADLQREFAQNSIRWKVEDAKRAGVHPLAALGVSPASFSPVSASFGDYSNVSSALADMGQNIDRAVLAGKDQDAQDKAEGIADTQTALTTRNMQLQNDLLQAQIDSLKAVRNTARVPAAPSTDPAKVNTLGGSKDAPRSSSGDYNYDPSGLFSLSRHGRTIFEYVHPDKADSITESQIKHAGAMTAAEAAASGLYEKVLNSVEVSDYERDQIAKGKMALERIPGVGWHIVDVPPPIRGMRGPARGGSLYRRW